MTLSILSLHIQLNVLVHRISTLYQKDMQMLLKELNKAKVIDEWTAPNLTTEPCKAPRCHMIYYHPKGEKE